MKKHVLAAALSLTLFNLIAQDETTHLRCGQAEAQEELKKQYPDYETLMKQKNELLVEQAKNFDYDAYMKTNATIIVPVVVHVIYNNTAQNISDAQVKSQIDVLNKDFSRTNADASSTPAAFQSIAGKTDFYFCLATKDPNGNPTNGINRVQTTVTAFQPGTPDVKYTSSGGADAWPPLKYLNIWVCNIANNVGGWGESAASVNPQPTMGAVLQYNVFGTTGSLQGGYNKGRCTTHEVGHVFDLIHIWGPDNSSSCSDDDYVSDTPKQAGVTFGACKTFPFTDACSSGNGIMYMNYMDYTYDACKNLFTKEQCARMLLSYNNSQKPWATSGSCGVGAGISEKEKFENKFVLFPNPSTGVFNIAFQDILPTDYTITIHNSVGQAIYTTTQSGNYKNAANIDLSGQANGVYFLTINCVSGTYHTNICVSNN